MKEYNKDIIAALELVLDNVYKVAQGKWVSVKEFSITKMLIDAGLHKNYAPPLVEVLKHHGFVEAEGERTGMRYKVVSEFIPDFETIAKEIKDEFDRKIREYNARRYEASADTKPRKPNRTPRIDDDFVGKVVKTKEKKFRKINIPTLLDTRYVLFLGEIFEVKIVGCKFQEETGKYLFDYKRKSGDSFIVETDQELSGLYENPEEIVKNLLKNIVKL